MIRINRLKSLPFLFLILTFFTLQYSHYFYIRTLNVSSSSSSSSVVQEQSAGGTHHRSSSSSYTGNTDNNDHNSLERIKDEESLTIITDTKEPEDETNQIIPLKPPYRILQFGQPRSGSTFQFALLQAIVSLKAQQDPSAKPSIIKFAQHKKKLMSLFKRRHSFILKSHDTNLTPEDLANVTVFASFKDKSKRDIFSKSALYVQTSSNLLSCSLCEVDHYAPYFDLSLEDVHHIKYFLSRYEIIRRCCGLQMSKYEMMRLHKCDMTHYRYLSDYPNCEMYNKTELELQLVNNPGGIKLKKMAPHLIWNKPGDCKYFDDMIVEKRLGFNGKPFDGVC